MHLSVAWSLWSGDYCERAGGPSGTVGSKTRTRVCLSGEDQCGDGIASSKVEVCKPDIALPPGNSLYPKYNFHSPWP